MTDIEENSNELKVLEAQLEALAELLYDVKARLEKLESVQRSRGGGVVLSGVDKTYRTVVQERIANGKER